MRVNMFEGARRIALAIGVLWALGMLAYAMLSEPYVSVTYAVPSYGATPVPDDGCRPPNASKYTTIQAPGGGSASVVLCFIADRSDDGRYLIPYREVVSASNPEAARIYAARKEALRVGANSEAARLMEFLFKMPVNPSDPRTVWMAGEFDDAVRTYMDGVAAAFRLPPSGLESLEKVKRQKLWEQWEEALLILFGGLAVGWVLTAGLGWVVRGFLGIARGKDQRAIE